jgi:hypothetical protein
MMMKEQIIGVMLGFSLFLGLLIGVGITSQTLRGRHPRQHQGVRQPPRARRLYGLAPPHRSGS